MSNLRILSYGDGECPFVSSSRPFVTFHIETSGLNPDRDHILEFVAWHVGRKETQPTWVRADWSDQLSEPVLNELYSNVTALHRELCLKANVDFPSDYNSKNRYKSGLASLTMLKQMAKFFHHCQMNKVPVVMHSAYRFVLPFLEAHFDRYLDQDFDDIVYIEDVLDLTTLYQFLQFQEQNAALELSCERGVEEWHTGMMQAWRTNPEKCTKRSVSLRNMSFDLLTGWTAEIYDRMIPPMVACANKCNLLSDLVCAIARQLGVSSLGNLNSYQGVVYT